MASDEAGEPDEDSAEEESEEESKATAAAAAPPPPGVLTSSDPLPLATRSHCFEVEFHPSEPLVAAATVTGAVELHRFDRSGNTTELLRSLRCHKESCRTARFLPEIPHCGAASEGTKTSSGSCVRLATASADRIAAVTDIESGKKAWKARMTAAGNSLLPLDPQRFVVGDDDGALRIFDVRQKKATVRWTENADYISDLAMGTDLYSLCATSGDGTLAVYDIRKAGTKGLIAMSDFQEDELLSCSVVCHGKKVICGAQLGVMPVFSWGDFGDQKDRIKGHPSNVDCIAKVGENAVLTGCGDGHVRLVTVYDKALGHGVLGIVAEVGDLAVEHIAVSPCGEFFATASHKQPAVSIWSMEAVQRMLAGETTDKGLGKIPDEEMDSSDEEVETKKDRRKKKRKKGGGAMTTESSKAARFFGDL